MGRDGEHNINKVCVVFLSNARKFYHTSYQLHFITDQTYANKIRTKQ